MKPFRTDRSSSSSESSAPSSPSPRSPLPTPAAPMPMLVGASWPDPQILRMSGGGGGALGKRKAVPFPPFSAGLGPPLQGPGVYKRLRMQPGMIGGPTLRGLSSVDGVGSQPSAAAAAAAAALALSTQERRDSPGREGVPPPAAGPRGRRTQSTRKPRKTKPKPKPKSKGKVKRRKPPRATMNRVACWPCHVSKTSCDRDFLQYTDKDGTVVRPPCSRCVRQKKTDKCIDRPPRCAVRKACIPCVRAKRGCGPVRPCPRCVKRGCEDQCIDRPSSDDEASEGEGARKSKKGKSKAKPTPKPELAQEDEHANPLDMLAVAASSTSSSLTTSSSTTSQPS